MFILSACRSSDGMEHGTEWQKEHTGWSFSTHFPLQSPSQGHHSRYGVSQILAEVDSLTSSWYKSSSVSYAPVSIQVLFLGTKGVTQ